MGYYVAAITAACSLLTNQYTCHPVIVQLLCGEQVKSSTCRSHLLQVSWKVCNIQIPKDFLCVKNIARLVGTFITEKFVGPCQ